MSLENDIKNKKLVFGFERTIKKIKNQKINKVYVASNSHMKEYISDLCKRFNVEAEFAGENSRDFGVLCKKPFSISVIGIE